MVVLDEYTADQDPESRERFYTDLLPRLREAGKTVIVVVHDTLGEGIADLSIAVEEGRVTATALAGR